MGLINTTKGQMELAASVSKRGGFDIMVGNPPFVTARDEEKRELYRERWKETCAGKFQLVAPFFQRSFGLLCHDGYLGFIVSNAFAKREFGKPLVENFFPTIELQKIIDTSGLMFPGHGTPTCIVFGRNRKPDSKSAIRVSAIVSGGGDLRMMPENSPLWYALSNNQDNPGYIDERISVADRKNSEMAKWPWNFDSGGVPTQEFINNIPAKELIHYLAANIGFDAISAANDIYYLDSDSLRERFLSSRVRLENDQIHPNLPDRSQVYRMAAN